MPHRSDFNFLNDLASNVGTLEADLLPEPPKPQPSRRDLEAVPVKQAPRPGMFLGLTAGVWLVLLLSFSLLGFCLYKHRTQESRFKVVAKPIAETQLGANVPGVNPIESDDLTFGAKVDPATWRAVHLTGHQADGTSVEIQVLRPLTWLADNHVKVGSEVPVDFGRIGVVGSLRVDSIRPCPTIRPGPGRTVTGIYRHHAHEVLTLLTENGEQIGLTPNHEIWSDDRREFIATRDLRIGETLRLLTGTTRISQIIPRQSGEFVYTLEVQVSHVFHVAKSGLLVHNCDDFVAAKGGAYGTVRAGNQGGQVHHTPAAKVTPFEYRKAPSVWMETADHQKTASWGRSKAAQAYRDKQDALINSGNLREVIQMHINDIRSKFGNKYDANIKQMLESFGFSE